jgi:hypothetical protein
MLFHYSFLQVSVVQTPASGFVYFNQAFHQFVGFIRAKILSPGIPWKIPA